MAALAEFQTNDAIATWGATPSVNGSNIRMWERIEKGDVVLFARTGVAFASAVVVHKAQSATLAEELWGRNERGETWEYLFFVSEVKEQSIPKALVNRLAGYEESNAWQRFLVVDEDRSAQVLTALNLESDVLLPDTSQDDLTQEMRRLAESGSTDILGKAILRKEQGVLRRQLFGGIRVKDCAICGKSFPIEFLVAAHIKKRSVCSLEERLDFQNIVMPLCKFGCDELFEKTYITIKDGIVSQGRALPHEGFVAQYVASLMGKACSYWSDGSRDYFRWHAGELDANATQTPMANEAG